METLALLSPKPSVMFEEAWMNLKSVRPHGWIDILVVSNKPHHSLTGFLVTDREPKVKVEVHTGNSVKTLITFGTPASG